MAAALPSSAQAPNREADDAIVAAAAFVERWEKATLVHGFLMESKARVLAHSLHWHSEPADQTHQEVRLRDGPIIFPYCPNQTEANGHHGLSIGAW